MSRTKRKLHPRTRQWLTTKTLIAPLGHPNWERHNAAVLRGQDGRNPSETRTTLNSDREGNTKKNGWCLDWTGSRHIYRRYTNRIQRAANKLKINHGIEDHFDALEDHGYQFDYRGNCINDDWYDDEEMDLPDWWYDPFREEEFYPDCAEPEEEPYDPWVDDIYYDDPWDHYPL
jgi:hypothetical protein